MSAHDEAVVEAIVTNLLLRTDGPFTDAFDVGFQIGWMTDSAADARLAAERYLKAIDWLTDISANRAANGFIAGCRAQKWANLKNGVYGTPDP